MASQLGKIYSGLLYEVNLWAAIAVEYGAGIIKRLCLDPNKLFLLWSFIKPFLHPRTLVTNKTLQPTIVTAKTSK